MSALLTGVKAWLPSPSISVVPQDADLNSILECMGIWITEIAAIGS
jgi:hypothetical protein